MENNTSFQKRVSETKPLESTSRALRGALMSAWWYKMLLRTCMSLLLLHYQHGLDGSIQTGAFTWITAQLYLIYKEHQVCMRLTPKRNSERDKGIKKYIWSINYCSFVTLITLVWSIWEYDHKSSHIWITVSIFIYPALFTEAGLF